MQWLVALIATTTDQIETNIHGLLSNFRTHLGAIANYERLNLKNLPEIDQFNFTNITVFKNVVKVFYDNHMNIEHSEQMAVECL